MQGFGQVALTVLLLIDAGLLVRTLITVRDLDPGFGRARKHAGQPHSDVAQWRWRSVLAWVPGLPQTDRDGVSVSPSWRLPSGRKGQIRSM